MISIINFHSAIFIINFILINLITLSVGTPYISSPGHHHHSYAQSFGYYMYPQRHVMRLDPAGKVKLGWVIDYAMHSAVFDMSVETNGFVGFGLNKDPGAGMTGADMVIGGVYATNGSVYFTDCFGTGNMAPKIDDHQDWELLGLSEHGMYTELRFARRLGTIDKEDVAIMNETINVIWAYGPIDGMNYHEGNRGGLAINLLDFKPDFSKFQKWALTADMVVPSNYSHSEWCTFYKAPTPAKKSFIVGFKPLMSGPMTEKYAHHLVVSKCWVPPGSKVAEVYDKFVGMPDDCYLPKPMEEQRPYHFCQSVIYAWGIGGKDYFVPEHMGYTIGEQPNEYYLLQVQYFNQNLDKDVKVETGVEIYYTM